MDIDLLPDPAIVADRELSIVAYNDPAEEIVGEKRNLSEILPKGSIEKLLNKGEIFFELQKGEKCFEGHAKVFGDKIVCIFRDVTKRKELEEQLKVLIDLSPDAIIVHDGRKILFANKRAAQFGGFNDVNEVIGQPIMNFVHPDYVELVKARIEKVLREKSVVPPIENVLLLPSGKKFVETSASYVEFGGKAAVLTVVRDITERKKMEKKLNESMRKYKSIFENSLDAIIITDLHGNFVEVNRAFEDITGYSREEIVGKNYASIVVDEYVDEVFKKYNEAYRLGKNVYGLEFEIITKRGERKFVEGNVTVLKNGAVEFLGNFRDVTVRKKMEEKLKRYNELLKAVSRINELIVRERDKIALLRKAAEEFAKLCEYSWIALRGEVVAAHGIDANKISLKVKCIEKALSGKCIVIRPGEHSKDCEHFSEHRDYNTYVFPMVYDDTLLGFIVMGCKDELSSEEIEQLQTLANDLAFGLHVIDMRKAQIKAIEQIEHNIEQFAAVLDQIRNPLAAIQGYVEIEGNEQLKEKVLEMVRRIERTLEALDKGWLESENVRKLLKTMW